MQFLVEAVVLSSLGGIIGIILALVGSVALTRLLQVPFIFDPSIVVGVQPAPRAGKPLICA
jgi:putative ABC transport system permease protein